MLFQSVVFFTFHLFMLAVARSSHLILFTEYIKNTAPTDGLRCWLFSANELQEIVVYKHRTLLFSLTLDIAFIPTSPAK